MTETEACYGTVEYYAELFSDILADVATGRGKVDIETAHTIMKAFERAICIWMKYHEDSVAQYRELHRSFIIGELPYKDDWS